MEVGPDRYGFSAMKRREIENHIITTQLMSRKIIAPPYVGPARAVSTPFGLATSAGSFASVSRGHMWPDGTGGAMVIDDGAPYHHATVDMRRYSMSASPAERARWERKARAVGMMQHGPVHAQRLNDDAAEVKMAHTVKRTRLDVLRESLPIPADANITDAGAKTQRKRERLDDLVMARGREYGRSDIGAEWENYNKVESEEEEEDEDADANPLTKLLRKALSKKLVNSKEQTEADEDDSDNSADEEGNEEEGDADEEEVDKETKDAAQKYREEVEKAAKEGSEEKSDDTAQVKLQTPTKDQVQRAAATAATAAKTRGARSVKWTTRVKDGVVVHTTADPVVVDPQLVDVDWSQAMILTRDLKSPIKAGKYITGLDKEGGVVFREATTEEIQTKPESVGFMAAFFNLLFADDDKERDAAQQSEEMRVARQLAQGKFDASNVFVREIPTGVTAVSGLPIFWNPSFGLAEALFLPHDPLLITKLSNGQWLAALLKDAKPAQQVEVIPPHDVEEFGIELLQWLSKPVDERKEMPHPYDFTNKLGVERAHDLWRAIPELRAQYEAYRQKQEEADEKGKKTLAKKEAESEKKAKKANDEVEKAKEEADAETEKKKARSEEELKEAVEADEILKKHAVGSKEHYVRYAVEYIWPQLRGPYKTRYAGGEQKRYATRWVNELRAAGPGAWFIADPDNVLAETKEQKEARRSFLKYIALSTKDGEKAAFTATQDQMRQNLYGKQTAGELKRGGGFAATAHA